MPGTAERSLPTQTADSYNLFLFHKRTALGLGMRAFARKLGRITSRLLGSKVFRAVLLASDPSVKF